MSDRALAGKGAVVTGAGRGIGAAVARALADAGAQVVLASRTASEIEETAAAIRAAGGVAHAVVCDVTDEGAVRRFGSEAERILGHVDILVANAGDASSSPIDRLTLLEWNRLFAANATSVFLCVRAFAREMANRRWGRIVVVASVAALEGGRYISAYAASKHAALGFVRSAAVELAARGVTVNALCPGYADTAMTERTVANVQARTGLEREEALGALLATTNQTRLVTPTEVAAAALRLCLDSSAGVTGQAILVPDGGEAAAEGAPKKGSR